MYIFNIPKLFFGLYYVRRAAKLPAAFTAPVAAENGELVVGQRKAFVLAGAAIHTANSAHLALQAMPN